MSIFGSLFGSKSNPADAAMPYLEKAGATEKEYLEPYIGRGGRAGNILEGQFGNLINDPAAMLEQFMGGYEPSKYYQTMQDRLSQATSNTAAAGGMRGSPLEQTQQQELTQGLLSKDMQDYLQNIMGLYGTGLSGEKDLFSTGYDASKGLSSDLSNIFGTEGQLAFQGEKEKNARNQGLLGSLVGLGSSFMGLPTGIGTSVGGDIFNKFFGK